jgi:hypothetical protein
MQVLRSWSANLLRKASQAVSFQSIRQTSSSQPSEYISANLANGVGRYVCQLQRITFKFCKEHPSSRGIRFYIKILNKIF